MKASRIVSAAISVLISSMLLFGTQAAHDFAYYVCLAMNIIGWLCCWVAGRKETARTMVDGIWLSVPLTVLYLYALASTGHPKLAASAFMLSFVILAVSFGTLQKKEAAQ